MAKIIPIRDLKDTTKVSEMCHASNTPIYITKNGYSDSVIMSNEVYERQMERIENYYRGMFMASEQQAVMKELDKLTPEDTLEAMLHSKTEEEAFFFEMLGNLLIQLKQRKVIETGDLF